MTDPRPSEHVLAEVFARDKAVWVPEATTGSIDLRNQAARDALAAGWTAEEIAETVGVRPDDVQRWAQAPPRVLADRATGISR